MSYYVYILYSKKFDKYYYGQTQDLETRIIKHNSGHEKSTSRFVPWEIHAFKEFNTRSDAMKIEKTLKNQKSRLRVSDYISKNNFTLLLADS